MFLGTFSKLTRRTVPESTAFAQERKRTLSISCSEYSLSFFSTSAKVTYSESPAPSISVWDSLA